MHKNHWLIVLFCTLGLSLFLFSKENTVRKQDVIKFSHKFHQEEAEAACTDCHVKAEDSTMLSENLLPGKEECEACHDVEDEETCTTCHFEDEETMMALPVLESDLVFNHKSHVGEQGLDCESCHKNLAQVDFADEHSNPKMEDCSSCHNNEQASLECAVCHKSTLNLRPIDHSADFLVSHKNIARFDQEDCAVCHTRHDCADCHDGAAVFSTTIGAKTDIQSPLFPSTFTGTSGLTLSKVHTLNFRATHGLEAAGRSQECVVCHDTQDFCQTCHEAEGVDVAGKPIWHGGGDWGALAGVVGTGGGRHADLAKRDMEMCAACHSTAGDDPTCLLCHTDFDGVQGTNPKTHESGFANRFSEDDSFHDDSAAMCYSCHTNTEQAGLGFCGYCHEAK